VGRVDALKRSLGSEAPVNGKKPRKAPQAEGRCFCRSSGRSPGRKWQRSQSGQPGARKPDKPCATITSSTYVGLNTPMQAAELGIPTQRSDLDLPKGDDIKINDTGPVMRAAGNVIELVPMNFSFPPSGRGGPVFNFKAEGRHLNQSKRCLIPASAFFKFTGKKYPNAKHRFTLNGAPFLAIAGIWRDGKRRLSSAGPLPDVSTSERRQEEGRPRVC
jgi:hypothetical protein